MMIRPANQSFVPPPSTDDRVEPPSRAEQLLNIQQTSGLALAIDVQWLRRQLLSALQQIADRTSRRVDHVDVLIANDPHMIGLNRTHAHVDHTTDVLSFDLADGGPSSPIQAEIAVCADEAARRAAEFGHSIERELLLYCIHGVLHCAGFDDQTEAGYLAMHREEDRILQEIGVGVTFDRHGANTQAAGGDDR